MEKYDAILKDWDYHPFWTGSITGKIYNDSKGRFVDGTVITTSTVQNHSEDIIQTRNTVYKLENKYGA